MTIATVFPLSSFATFFGIKLHHNSTVRGRIYSNDCWNAFEPWLFRYCADSLTQHIDK